MLLYLKVETYRINILYNILESRMCSKWLKDIFFI